MMGCHQIILGSSVKTANVPVTIFNNREYIQIFTPFQNFCESLQNKTDKQINGSTKCLFIFNFLAKKEFLISL